MILSLCQAAYIGCEARECGVRPGKHCEAREGGCEAREWGVRPGSGV